MDNHRLWPGTGLEVAEHPPCRSTLAFVVDQAEFDGIGAQ